MNAQEWNKLRKNYESLLDVFPADIIARLYVKGIIDCKDKANIQAETTNLRKMDQLLSILRSKPSEKKAYDHFLEALEVDHPDLAKEIRGTESTSDPSLKSQVDPHLLDGDVRTVLHKYLINQKGASTSLSTVREILQTSGVFKGNNEWKNKILEDFVWQEFLGVEIQQVKQGHRKNAKKQKVLLNIAVVEPSKRKSTATEELAAQAVKLSSDHNELQVKGAARIEQMNDVQLKAFLEAKMTEAQLPTDCLAILVREKIVGSVFMTLTDDDLKELIPSAPFGVRRFLSIQISENKYPVPQTSHPEYFRKFDTKVQHTDTYVKGHCVDACVNIRGKKTDPMRNFHLIDENEKEPIEFIISEVIPFVSACLNGRRNGTIFFGISPSGSDRYKHGEVVGVNISKDDLQAEINYSLEKCFSRSQRNIISSTVRDAKFVPVVSDNGKDLGTKLWVVEYDVVSSSSVLKDETIRTKLKGLPIHARNHKSKGTGVFSFSSDGVPEITSDDMSDFERDKKQNAQQRLEEETVQTRVVMPSDLRKKLLDLLTGGTELLQDTIYPFFMTSSIDSSMNEDYLSRNTAFIKLLNPEVVYDFDTTNKLYQNLETVQGEVMRILTTDNFDTAQNSREQYKTFTDSLSVENRIAWMFCNGYDEMNMSQMEPTEWNRKRRNAFQESLRFYKDNFDEERIIVIICLFSKTYDVMIEASEEVLTKFPENWLLLAESENIAKLWQNTMLTRHKAEKKAVEDRCVVGMPWEQINITISQAVNTTDLHCQCLLPTSSGALIDVKDKKLKDWCDIDVLSGGGFNDQENEKDKKSVEERFYRGEQVSWLNFYFHDQVLKRDIHSKLIQMVREALEGKGEEEEDKVTSISIFHQPGAGGTTSAKQVLWDLRKEYRCCVVNTITDQTCNQLDEVRNYGDATPKPSLILIDNEDEDKYFQLRGSLEERGRKLSRIAEMPFSVYCTIIICIRRSSLPSQIKQREVSLRQELSNEELNWFKEKNDSLETRFKKDQEQNINPKFLISFNILRENFNKEYISKVVKEFSDDVKIPQEVKLLKIISLLNTYDPEFRPVPVSCLDKILEHGQDVSNKRWPGVVKRNKKWEATLSQGVRVLLNLSSNKHHPGRVRNSLRVFSKIIAQEILTRMKERTKEQESEIMQELLNSETFEQENVEAKKLQMLISNVIRKREFKEDGRKCKFSKFVMFVKQNEGAEIAVKIIEQLFELKEDPFTAQLISRFYIDMKNWSQAECFARIATGKLPSNSFLWDTYGQVFKNQLFDRISLDGLRDEDIHSLVDLSRKCIDVFRKEQEVSEREVTSNGDNNFAGYFGELRAIILLLSALKMCPYFSSGDILHQLLIDKVDRLDCLHFMSEEDANYLKTLEKSAKEAMRRLDEEYLQMKGNLNLDMATFTSDYNRKLLLDLKINLDEYFGETSDLVPKNLKGSDECEYIRRRVRKLGATSLNGLLNLREQNKTNEIHQIYFLTLKNIRTSNCTLDDWITILNAVTVLLIDNEVIPDLEFNTLLQWCKTLYSWRNDQETHRSYLETFLYFILYNFPTDERRRYNICAVAELSFAIDKWQAAFKKNFPKSINEDVKLKRRETTLFFLGNGKPKADIVHQDSLTEMEQYSLTQKWDLPEVRHKLRMMSGILLNHGERVKITVATREGNTLHFDIQTSHKITKKDMWQKKVFFYVGFSFSGPRAFGMSTEELGIKMAPAPNIRSQAYSSFRGQKEQESPSLQVLQRDLKETQLKRSREKNPKAQEALDNKIKNIDMSIKRLIGEPIDD